MAAVGARRPTLVVLDFSGTLSIAATAFGAHGTITSELRASGLSALGIDSAELFWRHLVEPTWDQASTTGRGYTAALTDAAVDLLAARGRRAPRDTVRRSVAAFAARYFAHCAIAPQWRSLLRRLATHDGVALVVATDHYAEATGVIADELAALGVDAAPLARVSRPLGQAVIANSADLGYHKSEAAFWAVVGRALGVDAPARAVVIDDFGANEAGGDAYAARERVRRRRERTRTVLSSTFGVAPDVHVFTLPSPVTPAGIRARVDEAERFTMTVLSEPS